MIFDKPAPSRRLLVMGALAIALLPLLGAGANANPQQRAQDLVAQLSREVLTLINSPRSESQLYAEFERVLAQYADMPAVAQAALGPPWRSASPEQRTAYVAAFQRYLSRKYGRQFRDFQQASINVARVRDAGNAGILVETRLHRPRQQDIAVGWQISERSGGPRVVNLIIEGISMITNERAEIGAVLEAQRGSLDGLIQALRGRS